CRVTAAGPRGTPRKLGLLPERGDESDPLADSAFAASDFEASCAGRTSADWSAGIRGKDSRWCPPLAHHFGVAPAWRAVWYGSIPFGYGCSYRRSVWP